MNIIVQSFFKETIQGGNCCRKKVVGGQTYNLVENNDKDAISLGCKNACSYTLEKDTNLGGKYCFKQGNQEAKCLSLGRREIT